MTRCRPLQTCGASLTAILHIICTRMQMSQKMSGFEIPLLSTMLSLADDCILRCERIAEIAFPTSARVFDKIDQLGRAAEDLPTKFEDALNKLPMITHQVPYLDGALSYMIAWIRFLISFLSHWGSKTTSEKEITVDMSCRSSSELADKDDLQTFEDVLSDSAAESSFPALQCNTEPEENNNNRSFLVLSPGSLYSDTTETDNTDISGGYGKCSYKEILTKGVKENTEIEDDIAEESYEPLQVTDAEMKKQQSIVSEESVKTMLHEETGSEKIVKINKKRKAEKDQILKLFDEGWSLS